MPPRRLAAAAASQPPPEPAGGDLARSRTAARCDDGDGLWQRLHRRCRDLATACVAVATAAAVLGPASVAAADPTPLESAVTAWVTARSWVDRLEVPDSGSTDATLPLPGVSGVAVVLRVGGRVVATAEDTQVDSELLRRAVGRALRRLEEHPSAQWPAGAREEFARQLVLELEVLGSPQALLGRTFAEAAERIERGVDGMAMRRGDRWAFAFPCRLLATGTAGDPSRTLRQLARDLELPPLELSELLVRGEVAAYRVPAAFLAQQHPGESPVIAIRGTPRVPLRAIDGDAVTEMVDLILAHLQSRLVPAAEAESPQLRGAAEAMSGLGLRGDYDPIADRYAPLAAGPLEQALAAWVLGRLAETLPPSPQREAAERLASRILTDLAIQNPIEDPPLATVDEAAAISLASAFADPSADPGFVELAEIARSLLRTAVREQASEQSELLSPGRAILLAAAALELARRGRGDSVLREAAAVARSAWERASPSQRIGLLPWFALAARATEPPVIAATELGELRRVLAGRQIGDAGLAAAPLDPSPDLLGGFDLDDAVRPTADSRSIVPALGVCLLLSDPRLTPLEDLPAAIASHRRSLRFLRQLQVLPPLELRSRRPEAARGGIRAAPWEARQPLLPAILALWLLGESIDAGVPGPS
jgi:hypothetical protein